MNATSLCRVLFASIVVGMGNDLKGLYRVARIGQCETIGKWAQELGRAGRDGLPASATFYVCKGRRYRTMKAMRAFVDRESCLRMQIVNFYLRRGGGVRWRFVSSAVSRCRLPSISASWTPRWIVRRISAGVQSAEPERAKTAICSTNLRAWLPNPPYVSRTKGTNLARSWIALWRYCRFLFFSADAAVLRAAPAAACTYELAVGWTTVTSR